MRSGLTTLPWKLEENESGCDSVKEESILPWPKGRGEKACVGSTCHSSLLSNQSRRSYPSSTVICLYLMLFTYGQLDRHLV